MGVGVFRLVNSGEKAWGSVAARGASALVAVFLHNVQHEQVRVLALPQRVAQRPAPLGIVVQPARLVNAVGG